jgi:hypothetical protein
MAMPISTTTTLDVDEDSEHMKPDRVTPLLDGDKAGHPILGMSMRSFAKGSEDFASASNQVHIHVFATYS